MSAVEVMYSCTDEAIAVHTEVISTESFVRVSVYLHYALTPLGLVLGGHQVRRSGAIRGILQWNDVVDWTRVQLSITLVSLSSK